MILLDMLFAVILSVVFIICSMFTGALAYVVVDFAADEMDMEPAEVVKKIKVPFAIISILVFIAIFIVLRQQ